MCPALTHSLADAGQLPVLLRAHVLAVGGAEGHSAAPPLNLEHGVGGPEVMDVRGFKEKGGS